MITSYPIMEPHPVPIDVKSMHCIKEFIMQGASQPTLEPHLAPFLLLGPQEADDFRTSHTAHHKTHTACVASYSCTHACNSSGLRGPPGPTHAVAQVLGGRLAPPMQLLRFNGLTWRKPSCCSGLTPVAIALTTRLLRFKQMLRFSNNTKPELPIAQVPSLKAPTIAQVCGPIAQV